MKNKRTWNIITISILAFFILFLVYPIVHVFIKSVRLPDGTYSLDAFVQFFSKKYYTSTIWNSIKVTTLATIISLILGTILAYFFRSTVIIGKRTLEILVIISVLSPPFIGAYSWVVLLGRNGVITRLINSFGLNYTGIYGFGGILLVMSLKMTPLVYLYVSGALKNIDNSLNEAAENLGNSKIQRFIKITIPLIMPTLLTSALLVFMRSFADFGTPMLIGEGYRTLPVLIFNSFVSEMGGNESFGAAISVIVVILTTILFLVQKYIANRKNIEMTSLRPMPVVKKSGLYNIFVHLFSYILIFITFLPQIVVIITSFLKVEGKLFVSKFSLESYELAFSKLGKSITNTYIFSTIAILIILVIGVASAYAIVRRKTILTESLDVITMLPYVIPGSVIGIALILGFNKKPLLLIGTPMIMIIAFVIRRLPYTIRSTSAIIKQIDPSIEEASLSLGASNLKTFFKISLPTMKSGIISGAIMSWMSIISELSATIILYVASTSTLSIAIYTEVIRGSYGVAGALSTVLMGTTVIALLVFFKVSGEKDISI